MKPIRTERLILRNWEERDRDSSTASIPTSASWNSFRFAATAPRPTP